jgi:hypothetical protein
MPVFGPGTLTIGAVGEEIDVSCLINNAVLAASPTTSDPTTKLCGTQKQGTTTYSATLSGNIDIDPETGETSLFCLSWAEPGTEQPFVFIPNTENGTKAEGTLVIQPLDFGSSGAYGDDMTADFEFQVLWKPVITCAGDPDESGLATGATAGTPGTWTPANSQPPANLSTAQAAGITASPTTAWTTGQYVATADAAHIHWTGTAWATGPAADEAADAAAATAKGSKSSR